MIAYLQHLIISKKINKIYKIKYNFSVRYMSKINRVIILLVVIHCIFCVQFDISSVSTCVKESEKGYCTRWEQNGTVQENYGACFSKQVKVLVWENQQQLTKTMGELKVGDLVLGWNGQEQVYSHVITWIHREPETQIKYLKIKTDGGSFISSDWHNIALSDGSFAFANQLKEKKLYLNREVLSVEEIFDEGLFSPYTEISNYFVLTDQNEKILAHSFANIRNPEFYQVTFKLFINVWTYLNGEPENMNGIHPLAKWMKEKFSFMIHQ